MKNKKNLLSIGLVLSALILALALFITICLYADTQEPFFIVGVGTAGLSTPLLLVVISVLIREGDNNDTGRKE